MTPLEIHGDGISARVLVDGDAARPITPTPTLPDVSRLPGATVLGVASHAHDGVRVVVGCIRAPSDKWVPGLASVVFERATPMILGAASLHPSLERAPAPPFAGVAFAEGYRGHEGDRAVVLVHALAFVGSDADAVACSLACAGPAPTPQTSTQTPTAARCDAIASSFAITGDLKPEPPPGLLARAILGAADQPTVALAVVATVAVAIVAQLLFTRPRLRPTARGGRRTASSSATSSSARARPR